MAFQPYFFSIPTVQNLYLYWRLDQKVPLEALSFTPRELTEDKYTLWVYYRYLSYDKREELATPIYKNPYAAEEGAKKLFKGIKSTWIDSKNPSVSALSKEIDYKQLAYTLILWGAYFYILFF